MPCDCGESVVIEAGQAGQQVTCKCGATLEVPTLRGVKQLDVYESPTAKEAAVDGSGWNALFGVMFSLGLLLLVIAGPIAGYLFYQASGLDTDGGDWSNAAAANQSIDNADTFHLLDIWKDFRESGLGPKLKPQYLANRETVSQYQTGGTIAAAVAVIGLLLVGGSIALPRSQK